MGKTCSKFVREHSLVKHTFLMEEDVDDELCQAQISVQCKENPDGQDGMMVFDMEAFPMVNILCVEDRPKGLSKQQ
ncbi:hypothetical protein ABG768_015576 [Culter alburnus]|uniref:Uncharacterized protein n=1 Tax=Culter alburnus TaxID=194366 RepID=A0AAW1Z6R4_CULAL